jgi:hypothetical protein
VNAASAVALAVAAGSVDFAVVVGIEVDDIHMAAAVMLDDLVVGAVCTSANDVGSAVTLDGDGIFADVLEPDELEVAATQAVDALLLVGTDDDVLQGCALFKNEDSVRLT